MTATLQRGSSQETSALITAPPRIEGPLVVATDASPSSDAALRAAQHIARISGQQVLLLAVHTPLPVLGPEVPVLSHQDVERESRNALLALVEAQLERVGVDASWPINVSSGHPAATIARMTKHVGAQLVVMGLGGHGVFDRIFGDEMVLQVLRIGTVPVLAVAESFPGLPLCTMAAVDFSASSKRALELGASLVRSGTSLTLAHVIASDSDPVNWLAMDPPRVGRVSRALDRFAAEVDLAEGVLYDRRVVAGDPADELLALVTALKPDLIVTGSHGHNFLSRLFIGSVSTSLLRKAGCSILIAPPVDAPEVEAEIPPPRGGRFTLYEWTERLEEFSRRNLWRACRLESINASIGAQVVESGVSFTGASYDPRAGNVHLMFGTPDHKYHATHCVADVSGIQILKARDGEDLVLRIGHGGGQTLLTLER